MVALQKRTASLDIRGSEGVRSSAALAAPRPAPRSSRPASFAALAQPAAIYKPADSPRYRFSAHGTDRRTLNDSLRAGDDVAYFIYKLRVDRGKQTLPIRTGRRIRRLQNASVL